MLLNVEISREGSPLELMGDLLGTCKLTGKGGELMWHRAKPHTHNSDLDLILSTWSICSTVLLSRQKPVCLRDKFKPSSLGWETRWWFLSQSKPELLIGWQKCPGNRSSREHFLTHISKLTQHQSAVESCGLQPCHTEGGEGGQGQ